MNHGPFGKLIVNLSLRRHVMAGPDQRLRYGMGSSCAGELTARGDAELPEYFPEVVVDGVGAEVELCGDLRIGRACGG